MTRWFRHTLRRYGLNVLFKDVICLRHAKTVWLRVDGQVEVTIERALAFLAVPEPGAVRDVVPVLPEKTLFESPDARELVRTSTRSEGYVYWTPRDPVVPYALHSHLIRWSAPGDTAGAAVYSDVHCETRTGILGLEIVTPARFEAAVAFKRPRWGLSNEGKLMKHALRALESGGERPSIVENGCRLEWTIAGPKIGERYVCVAFHEGGVALWRKRLQETTLGARLRRLAFGTR